MITTFFPKQNFTFTDSFVGSLDFAEITKSSVSYIYYPSTYASLSRGILPCGHAELEIEEKSWTLLKGHTYWKPLSAIIFKSEINGRPFFRYHITVTPRQFFLLQLLGHSPSIYSSYTCSLGAASALAKLGDYSIPWPLRLAPATSAAFLTCAYFLGSRRIERIEFYSDSSRIRNIFRCCIGISSELLVLSCHIWLCWKILEIATDVFLKSSRRFR